jgi:hypothetical protein
MTHELRGPGRFSITYVSRGAWNEGRHTKRLTLDESEGWEEAKEKLWRKYHFNAIHPYRPTMELHRWVRMEPKP